MFVKKVINLTLVSILITILWIAYWVPMETDIEQRENLSFEKEKSGLQTDSIERKKGGAQEISTFLPDMPTETPYPEPGYKPSLRPYRINQDDDMWRAQDPSSYITPQNGWVKHYASQLYIDYDGRIRYKNIRIPLLVSNNGTVILWVGKPFLNNYRSDDIQFNYPVNGDMWVMPDYYLTNGASDDCDGWAVTVASLMLSGETSIRQNGSYVKKLIPAKVVLGYVGGYRDAWVEYDAYNKTFFTSTSLINTGIDGKEKKSSTEFVDRYSKTSARGKMEFTDKYFGKYSGTGNIPDINKSDQGGESQRFSGK